MVSEQVAGVLRRSGTHVRLVVARPADPAGAAAATLSDAPVVPTRYIYFKFILQIIYLYYPPFMIYFVFLRLLSDLEALDRYLTDAGFPEIFNAQSTPSPTPPLMEKSFLYDVDPADDSDNIGNILVG